MEIYLHVTIFFLNSIHRFVVVFLILPETENRTLEDIESHFSDNTKGLTDRKIAKVVNVVTKNPSISISNNMNEMSDAKQQPPISKVQEGCDNRGFVMEAMKR